MEDWIEFINYLKYVSWRTSVMLFLQEEYGHKLQILRLTEHFPFALEKWKDAVCEESFPTFIWFIWKDNIYIPW